MKTKKIKRRAIIAGTVLASLLLAAPLKAEPMITVGANSFAGSHGKQGTVMGGGVSIQARDRLSFRAKIDFASLSLEIPVIYSYGAFFNYPVLTDISLSAFCRKDGFAGILGCGAEASIKKNIFRIGAGGEYRPGGTISVNSSISSKIKIAFLKIKAKILGFLNTKKDDSKSGGVDAEVEIAPLRYLSIYGRYNYLNIEEVGGRHAGIGGLRIRNSF